MQKYQGGGGGGLPALLYVVDAVWFVYTRRRLIDLSLIAGTSGASQSRSCPVVVSK